MNWFAQIHPVVLSVAMLAVANVFMTFAWYGHLRHQSGTVWYVAALVSWGIALFEYLIQVPANRIGHGAGLSVGQLKSIQEVVTLIVFVPFALFFLKEPLKLDYLWAGLCLIGAVYFVFRQ
ncbi:MAG: DMT family protein [Alphaproteobacteria bacterium]|nr:DMT family protein [Alphaproteobacteria bacterium]